MYIIIDNNIWNVFVRVFDFDNVVYLEVVVFYECKWVD